MIGWDLMYISEPQAQHCLLWPKRPCPRAQENPADELKAKREQTLLMNTHLDLPAFSRLVVTPKGFQVRSRIQRQFTSPHLLKKCHNRGYKLFTHFI